MPEEIYENTNNLINNEFDNTIIEEVPENIQTTNKNKKIYKGNNKAKFLVENKFPMKRKVENDKSVLIKNKYVHTCVISNTYEYLVFHIMKYIENVINSKYIKRQDVYNVITKVIKNRITKNIVMTSKCEPGDEYIEEIGIKISRIKAYKRIFEKELVIWNDITKIFAITNEEEYNKIISFLNEKINKLNEEYNKYL